MQIWEKSDISEKKCLLFRYRDVAGDGVDIIPIGVSVDAVNRREEQGNRCSALQDVAGRDLAYSIADSARFITIIDQINYRGTFADGLCVANDAAGGGNEKSAGRAE